MSDVVDLNPTHLAVVQQILSEHVPDCEVRAFGSRATWTAKDYSDLDLAVVDDGPLDWRTLGDLKEAFEESTLPMRVDVVDWNGIKDNFRQRIEPDCVIIRASDRPTTWPLRLLGDLVTNLDSRRVPLSRREREIRSGLYPYFGATGVIDYVDDYLFEGLHLLVAEDGSVEASTGAPFIQLVDGQFWVNNHAHVLRGSSDEETRYLSYALSTVQVRPFISGSVQEKLSQANLQRLPVPYPSLQSHRRAIVHVLRVLDDKIELNRRMSETLDEMARALFRSWFVDFDPVHAKAQGRPTGLPDDLDALFPDSFEPSELGDIPTGWQAGELGDVAEQIRDNMNPLDQPDVLYQHYSIPAYDTSKGPVETLGRNIRSAKSRVESGSVLLSKLNPEIARVWLVDVEQEDRAICSTEFMVLVPREPFDRYYIYSLAQSIPFRCQIESLVTGTSKSHQRAPAAAILTLPLVRPPASVVAAFGQLVAESMATTLQCQKEANVLSTLRDTLLPKLLSGKLRIPVGASADSLTD